MTIIEKLIVINNIIEDNKSGKTNNIEVLKKQYPDIRSSVLKAAVTPVEPVGLDIKSFLNECCKFYRVAVPIANIEESNLFAGSFKKINSLYLDAKKRYGGTDFIAKMLLSMMDEATNTKE